MERLEREIREELTRFGPPGGMPEVLAAWPESVGEMIAANAWPARIARDGTLHVNTSSAAWAFELSQLAPTILDRLSALLGESAPKAIRFTAGHVPEPALASSAEPNRAAVEPTAEALQRAAELTAEIADDELRDSVARAASLSLSTRRSDSSV